ncbi:MAG: competence/damage-inducible protein A [Bacteroidales bacterium]
MTDASIISIGNELLTGQRVNTNASWIASRLNLAGIEAKEIQVVGDEEPGILRAIHSAAEHAGLVLITGGLGPTRDDITKNALCKYFNCSLQQDPGVLEDIRRFFLRRGLEINELNSRQALVPEKATVLRNPYGTAPGLCFQQDNTIFIAMPGVPFEMKAMMDHQVIPLLEKQGRKLFIIHKTILTQGIGESALAELIATWENSLPETIRLAYLPSPGIVRLRLTARGDQEQKLKALIHQEVGKLHSIIPEFIWGYDDDSLEGVTGKILKKHGLRLGTAESCTGGYIAHRITSIPGSSEWFNGSIVAYANVVKEQLLHVSPGLIRDHGAVSQEVAKAMATGAKNALNCHYAIGVTGIAGPGGGSETKPVGTVCIAVAGHSSIVSRKYQFGDNRERNIIRSGNAALALLKEKIESDLRKAK